MAVECPLCQGRGMVVWKITEGIESPCAMTGAEENDMDIQKCECPACNGTGIEPGSDE